MSMPRNLSPSGILRHITHSRLLNDGHYTYLITGKVGPTGKTWLHKQLTDRGYSSIEIPQEIYQWSNFHDDKNHFIVDDSRNAVLIVLNRRLPMEFL